MNNKKSFENMIYGIRAVIETIQSGQHLEKVFVQKNLKGDLFRELMGMIRKFKVPVSTVPQEKINRFTRKNHQGVVAFVSPVQYHDLHQVLTRVFEEGRNPFVVVLDRVTDVRNFGAIARSAECMGADAIVIPTKNSAQINADAVKTSAGALNFIPVCRDPGLKESLQYLQDSGLQLVACTEKANKELPFVDLSGPVAIIMGSEEEGISPDYLHMADLAVKIPMSGHIASLNVSAASAMVFYEVVRQRLTVDFDH